MRPLLVLAVMVLSLLTSSIQAEEKTIERYVELRDGTILRLAIQDEEWKISALNAKQEFETRTIQLSAVKKMTLCPEPVMERKKKILALIKQSGSDDFNEREEASEKLAKMGPDIRVDLEEALPHYKDPEIERRLKEILDKLPAAAQEGFKRFDEIVAKETLRGDILENVLKASIQGQFVKLARKDVKSMSAEPLPATAFPKEGTSGKLVVQSTTGERILCSDIEFTGKGLKLQGLSAGFPDLDWPITSVQSIMGPKKKNPESDFVLGLYVQLKDGSVMFTPKSDTGPNFSDMPNLLKSPDEIVGMWTTLFDRPTWPKDGFPARWNADTKSWVKVADVTLEEKTIRWTGDPSRGDWRYFDMPPVVLQASTPAKEGGVWQIDTGGGTRAGISDKDFAKLTGKLSKGVTLPYKDRTLTLSTVKLDVIQRIEGKK